MRNQLLTLVAAWKAAPYTQLRAADHRGWAYDRITAELQTTSDYTITAGPYAGMKYFGPPGIPIVDTRPAAKLLGSFEEEINPWIETLIAMDFSSIVHIGCGEGYHVVGMARRLPNARTIAFDTLIAARQACRVLAVQNKVMSRLQLRGFCGADELLDVELAGSLVFSDCGGAELIALDPALYPSLSRATMLVETHDAFDIRVTPRLIARFSATHRIEWVSASTRDPSRYQMLQGMPLESAQIALAENRPISKLGKPQRWALLTPYSS